MASPDEILLYWFGTRPANEPAELEQRLQRWYSGGEPVAHEIRERFGADVDRALAGDYDDWASDPRQRLALILLLDQFTRSLFAGTPRAFAGDPKAQALSRDALDRGWHESVSIEERLFYVMPLMHAESVDALDRCIVETERLTAAAPEPLRPVYAVSTAQARKYRDVIARFGRFPHRNQAIGRTTTEAEAEFLTWWRQPPSKPP